MAFRKRIKNNHSFALASILLLTSAISGCYMTPNFGAPGTIGMQRSRAVVHDPFPDNDIAPPIMGGRPLGFDRPMAEAEKNQSDFRSGGARVVPYQGM